MYQVVLLNSAKKDLKKLDKKFQKKAIVFLRMLKTDPLLGVKLSGELQGFYKIKIPPLRIVYTPDFEKKIIWVKAIGFRGGVYR
ncbi:MAG: type II toxin-antitoxin system RelE family toxin [Minisyncoccia bacterium]